ncbi:MAG TPA: glycosyltransferase [Rhizomicrobium sp.]|jgi:glycosyltransferase involved in cell wall biosynthesis
MQVSVIVPHYNDPEGLEICLAALGRQTFPAERVEIVVADNNSPQGIAAVEKIVAGRARVVTVIERGAGPARNGGAAASRGELLAFIDSDCRADPIWLAQGIKALDHCDIAGGSVDVLVKDAQRMTAAEAFECIFAFNMERYVKEKGFVGSGNLFCRRAVFEAVGPFGIGVSEDVDWSHRATAKSFRIGYAPLARVGHPARRSWSELKRKWERINLETYGLVMRRPFGRLSWLKTFLLLPLSALAHTPKVLASGQLNGQQKLAALGMLYRLRLWRMVDYGRLLLGGR